MRQSIINKLNSNNMSKKAIEQEHKYGSIEVESFTPENLTLTQINDFTCDEVIVSKSKATTVAKAIDPEYQKVIDQNAKLVEALEIISEYGSTGEDAVDMKRIANQALQNTKNIEG